MSKYRERAAAIKAEGEAVRGNYTPTGAPLRAYQNYYAGRSDAPARENFCHFWRVVLIWAPLNAVWKRVEPVVNSLPFAIVSVLAFLAVLVWAALTFSTFGQVVAIILASLAFVGALFGFVWLVENYFPKRWEKYVPYVAAVVIGGFILAALTALFIEGLTSIGLLATLGLFLGIPLGLAALIFSLVKLSEYVKARSRVKSKERDDAYWAYYEEHGEEPPSRPVRVRKPSRVKAFFSGVGDFLVLIGQAVRVKKWKICPLVEVPNEDLA